jgi:hypothetical protein
MPATGPILVVGRNTRDGSLIYKEPPYDRADGCFQVKDLIFMLDSRGVPNQSFFGVASAAGDNVEARFSPMDENLARFRERLRLLDGPPHCSPG